MFFLPSEELPQLCAKLRKPHPMRRVFESFPLSFRLVFIVPLIVVGYVVGMLVGLMGCMIYGYGPQEAIDLLSDFQNTSDVGVLRILQTCFQFGGFLLPAVFFLWMFGRSSVNEYMLRKPNITWLLVPLITILSLPIMEVLINFNQKLIPASSSWGAALRKQEAIAESMMEQLLAMKRAGANIIASYFAKDVVQLMG